MRAARLVDREHAWYCESCSARLAWFDRSGLHLHPALTRLDGDEDGMPRYGLSPPERSRFYTPRGRAEPDATRRLPLVVYCPACRAKQRLAS